MHADPTWRIHVPNFRAVEAVALYGRQIGRQTLSFINTDYKYNECLI